MPIEHLVEAWGHPTEASSCGNRAAHHASATGFWEGLTLLDFFLSSVEGGSQRDNQHRYLSLLSQTNENGDTPLMMACACVSDHGATLDHMLENSFRLALTQKSDENVDARVKVTSQSIQDAFNMRNSENCTALNLACGHGHTDTVRFLIRPQHMQLEFDGRLDVKILPDCNDKSTQKEFSNTSNAKVYIMDPLVNVTYDDVDFCKKSVENLTAGLKYMKQQKQDEQIREFELELKHTKECQTMLECELERISSETANALLQDSGNEGQSVAVNISTISDGAPKLKVKTKKKKRKQKCNNTKENRAQNNDTPTNAGSETKAPNDVADVNTTTNNMSSPNAWASVKKDTEKKVDLPDVDASPFVTLRDGSIVSKSHKPEIALSIQADTSALKDVTPANSVNGTKPKSLQSILKSTSVASSTNDDDIAAIMESPCLDPSMLLLSPHGMAMEMSPCQLDAVESILSHQLSATMQAQNIQSRLLDKK